MAKLLYTATRADGNRTEGFVDAASAAAARDALIAQGLRGVVLHQEPAAAQDESQLAGLSVQQQRALARLHLSVTRSPNLAPVLAEVARRLKPWLLVNVAMVAYGAWAGVPLWLFLGLLCAATPFALTAWGWRHAGRYKRLLEVFSLGDWAAARVLIEQLRPVSRDKLQMAFDLDVRLAYIEARQHSLAQALTIVHPWQAVLAAQQPGLYEGRVATVHHAAGDTEGFLRLMEEALARLPGDPSRTVDAALAHGRFGDVLRAKELLAGVDASLLPPHAAGFVHWTQGLIELRQHDARASATLGRAVAAFLGLAAQPAVWTALAFATLDHAIASNQAGRGDEARAGVAHVWPIVKAHAQPPLLKLLEAEGLLPAAA